MPDLTRLRPYAWALATAATAFAVALGLSWCIVRAPLTLYDSLNAILDARSAPSLETMVLRAIDANAYWRPLILIQAKLVVDTFSDPMAAFKAIHVALTAATFLLFAALVRPRSPVEFAAAAIALMIVAGHHTFFVLFTEGYPVNHFLEVVVLCLAVAVLARGPARWWKDALALVMFVLGLMMVESGLLIGVVAASCWAIGWRGISGRGLAGCVLVVAAYVWVRYFVLDVGSPWLDERAAGWWLIRLEPPQLIERFGANPLPYYAYNLMAALLDVLVSEPRGGSFLIVGHWLEGALRPWMVLHVVSSLLLTAIVLTALRPALARWRARSLNDRDRFVLLGFALVAANTVISFGYVKDEVLSVGAVFYAAAAFAVLATLMEGVHARPVVRIGVTTLVLATSVLWSARAAGTYFSLQLMAYRVASDWAVYSLEREQPRDWDYEPTRQMFLDLQRRNVGRDVPHPRMTPQRHVDRYLGVE
jgi:hypothetical protein